MTVATEATGPRGRPRNHPPLFKSPESTDVGSVDVAATLPRPRDAFENLRLCFVLSFFGSRGHPLGPADVARLDEGGHAVAVLPAGLELDLVGLTEEPQGDVAARSAAVDRLDRRLVVGSGRSASTSPRLRRSSGLMNSVAASTSRHRAPHRTPSRGHARCRCPSASVDGAPELPRPSIPGKARNVASPLTRLGR